MRPFHQCAALALLGSVLSLNPDCALAQGFPTKPIRVLVGFSAGSGTDIVARAIAQKLNEAWGQPVVVDNRPGAGGNIAADIGAKVTPDGYTLLLANNALAISATLYRKLPYSARRDLAPVTQVTSAPLLLVVSLALPVDSVKDLIAYAKSRPGQTHFASAGTGNADHMAGELFKNMAGIDLVHVPYKGGPPALIDVVAGRVALYFSGLPTGLPLAKAGKVKALGVTSVRRSAAAPDIPTIAEAALPGYEVNLWYGILAPQGTPHDIVEKLNSEINRILKSPDIQERFMTLGVDPAGGTAGEFAAFFKSEIEKWAKVIRTIGLAID